jgi:diguanylate cyclase (GGDEF)-like protein
MRPLRGPTFAHKMTLMALLASTMALGTLMTAFLVFDTISSRSLLQSRLSALGDVVGQNSTAALNFNDRTAAVEVLEGLRAEPPILTACLYDVPGKLFAQYEREKGPWECPPDLKRIPSIDREYSSVIRPVFRHNELVGTLFLSSNLEDLQKRKKRLLQVASVLLLLALVVGGVSASLLQRRISKPVSELVHAMHNVTVGQDFDTRVAILGSDEIAQLGMGFNVMLSELQRREDAKKNAEAKLQFQALNDALTGLPNRRLFSDRLSQILALARREQRMVALLYIDLDGFKLVNDSLGHSVGDSLLVQVAARWRSRVRQADTLARLGGDEFTVILGGLHAKEDAVAVAKSLLDVLATPFLIDDHQLTIGASIGISLFPKTGATLTNSCSKPTARCMPLSVMARAGRCASRPKSGRWCENV